MAACFGKKDQLPGLLEADDSFLPDLSCVGFYDGVTSYANKERDALNMSP
jgi:hypothetical protein